MVASACLSVLVKRGGSVAYPRTIVRCEWIDTFGTVIRKLSFPEEMVFKVLISKNEKFIDPCHIVPISSPVKLCDQFQSPFVCYYLIVEEKKEVNMEVGKMPSLC